MTKTERILGVRWKGLGLIFTGTALLALGLAWYADPLGLVTGGITGAAIVLSQLSELAFGFAIPLGVVNLILNIPIFVLSGVQQGFRFVKKSLIGMLLLSIWLGVFQWIPNPLPVSDELLLGALLSGVPMGAGLALVLRTGATTGGTDMLAACLHRLIPHFSISVLIFAIDAVIIAAGLFVFGVSRTIYAVVSVFICSKLIDSILGGVNFAKAVFILSQKSEEISEQLFHSVGRGNTGIPVRGMYSGEQGEMLMAVVRPRELPLLKQAVHDIDPNAFVTVCSAQEVLCEGFVELSDAVPGKRRIQRKTKHTV